MYTIDLDIGGTFTDGFFTDGQTVRTAKHITTPHDLTLGVMGCLSEGAVAFDAASDELLRQCEVFRLSTTLATNMIVQRNGSRIGLLVTKGYEDSLYGPQSPAPATGLLIPRDMIVGIDEAVDAGGGEQRELDPAQVMEALRYLIQHGARLVGVSLRNASGNPSHEEQIRAIVRDRYPTHYLRSVPLQLGSEVSHTSNDYTRTNTLLLNTYLHREMVRGLYRIEDEARGAGYQKPMFVVHASGGCARVAKTVAVQTLHSGPAAAVQGAWRVAQWLGLQSVITTDVGGTSLDVGFVDQDRPPWNPTPLVENIPLAIPMLGVESLGAGGGSIARVNDAGVLTVGPDSAGALPGPVCYDKGGVEPTVTDADLILGYIDPGYFLGGRMKLDVERARAAVERRIARRLSASVESAAWQVRRRVDEDMARAIAAGARARGLEAANSALFSFGGAGPLHAAGMAEALGISRIVAFPFGAAFSAFGSSTTDVVHWYGQTVAGGNGGSSGRAAEAVALLKDQALRDMRSEGFTPDEVEFKASLTFSAEDGRQTLAEAPSTDVSGDSTWRLVAGNAAGQLGVGLDEVRLETLWLSAEAKAPHWTPPVEAAEQSSSAAALKGERPVFWSAEAGFSPTPIYDRALLQTGARVDGPAIVEGPDTGYVLPPGWALTVESRGFLMMDRQ